MKIWTLSHGKDGTTVALSEIPWWAQAVQEAGDNLCWAVEKATGFCFIAPPEWTWNLGWGDRDADGCWEWSAGRLLHEFGDGLLSGFGAWRLEQDVAQFPVTPEWVKENVPSAGAPFNGEEYQDTNDEEEGTE